MTEEAFQDVGDQRQEFLEHRQSGIGATDSPKILGFSKYGTSLSVYYDKVEGEDRGMSLPAWLGIKMQTTVAELYTAATGQRVRAANQHYRHKKMPFVTCHLDFRAWGKPKLLVECKTRAYMKGWGEDGTAEIPVDVWVQVQHEMAVMDAEECHVAVLFGHHTFRVYVIKRDAAFIEKLLVRLHDWWHVYYLARVAPPASGHDLDTARVKADHVNHDDTIIAATAEQAEVISRLRQAVVNEEQAGLAANELRNKVREMIGDHAGISGAFGTITWKRSRDSLSTDWEQVAVTYGNVIEDLLLAASPGDNEEEVARLARAQKVYETAHDLFTQTKPGSRRFSVNFTGGN